MSGVMPPEPPPPAGERDYDRRSSGTASPATGISPAATAFSVDDIPVPSHIESLEPTPDLNAAWAAVLKADHEPIPKRGYNNFFKYNYATADDIRMYVGKVLGAHGLHYEQHVAGYTPWGALVRVTYYFVVRHSSGQSSPPIRHDELVKTTSEKGGPDDKALGKALVLALKNWSKVIFSIDTGDLMDDPDGDGPVVEPAPQQQTRAAASTRTQASGRHGFRDAGLPPKAGAKSDEHWREIGPDEIFEPGHSFRINQTTGVREVKVEPSPHDPQTGEVISEWAARRLKMLADEPPGKEWLSILQLAFEQCPSAEDLHRIEIAPSYSLAMEKAPPKARKQITDWRLAALERLATPEESIQKETSHES